MRKAVRRPPPARPPRAPPLPLMSATRSRSLRKTGPPNGPPAAAGRRSVLVRKYYVKVPIDHIRGTRRKRPQPSNASVRRTRKYPAHSSTSARIQIKQGGATTVDLLRRSTDTPAQGRIPGDGVHRDVRGSLQRWASTRPYGHRDPRVLVRVRIPRLRAGPVRLGMDRAGAVQYCRNRGAGPCGHGNGGARTPTFHCADQGVLMSLQAVQPH
jgi:hypothetical protein